MVTTACWIAHFLGNYGQIPGACGLAQPLRADDFMSNVDRFRVCDGCAHKASEFAHEASATAQQTSEIQSDCLGCLPRGGCGWSVFNQKTSVSHIILEKQVVNGLVQIYAQVAHKI